MDTSAVVVMYRGLVITLFLSLFLSLSLSLFFSLSLSLTLSLPSLQSAQLKDRSTMTVSTRVFLALVPVKNLS